MLIFYHTQNYGYLKPQNNGDLKKPLLHLHRLTRAQSQTLKS